MNTTEPTQPETEAAATYRAEMAKHGNPQLAQTVAMIGWMFPQRTEQSQATSDRPRAECISVEKVAT